MAVKQYGYHLAEKLAENLEKADIEPGIISKIMEGGKALGKEDTPKAKAEWMKSAMMRMQKLLDLETCKTVREGCACCLSGKRDKMAKQIFKENGTLEDRIKAANEAHYVFGHSVTMLPDGKIQVQFFPEGWTEYRCPCNSKAQMTMPITYCFCCGGHAKYHLQNPLGHKLDCTTLYTVRSTGGKKPCTFSFRIVD